MPNTLTGLLETINAAANKIPQEPFALVNGVFRNSTAERVGKDATVQYPIVGTMTASDLAPAAYVDPADQTISRGTMTINKFRSVKFHINGEEGKALGASAQDLMDQRFQQAFRTIRNEIETDLAALYKNVYAVSGTAGTTPFGSSAADLASLLKVMQNNGTPRDQPLRCVLDINAAAAYRSLPSYLRANEAGSVADRAAGLLGTNVGFTLGESYAVTTHTKGTCDTGGAAKFLNKTLAAAGATSLDIKTGSSGTLKAGDILTAGGSTYVVTADVPNVSGGTASVSISPGLRAQLAADAEVTVAASHVPSLAFHPQAFHLLTRLPEMPEGGDAADDVTEIMDESGIAFQIAVYRQYRRVAYEVAATWGVKAVNPEFACRLYG